jgi:RNA polymerase sigma factor (sigma-70 family)
MTTSTLEELLAKLCQGDMDAAEQVFRTYEPYLRKVVRRQLPARLRPKFDSEDVVQSTWAGLLRRFRDSGLWFPDAEHLRNFLITATRHRFVDRLRQYRTEGERELPLPESGVEGLPAATPRPSERAQAAELWERMLQLCKPKHRVILEMKRQGRPMADIVARTGLHEDSIRRILKELSRRVAFPEQPVAPASDADA